LSVISIAITSYNACETIEDAINSALNQDWSDKEIIIYDDCSTDGTVDLLTRLERLYPQLKVIYGKENRGVAYARNQLINNANGEFIAFFDDDDISLPNRLSAQYAAIMSTEKEINSELVICHTARQQIYPNGYQRYEGTMGCDSETIPFGKRIVDRILIGRLSPGVVGTLATCSQMARKSIYLSLKGFDTSLRRIDDTDFNIRLAFTGAYFVGIAEPLVRQTMTMGEHKKLDKILGENMFLYNKYADYLTEKGWLAFNIKWQAARVYFLEKNILRFLSSLIYIALLHPLKLAKRIYWSLPAAATRRDFKKWHHGQYDSVIFKSSQR
jgi:glycosyltransferase involved in cell wall biosynthesis